MIKTIGPFDFTPPPQLHFGCGKISVLPAIAKGYGSRVLLITGKRSFDFSLYSNDLLEGLGAKRITIVRQPIDAEPSPAVIDAAVIAHASFDPDVVVAIGGGSVLDAAKAVAAMLPVKGSVKDYLEGVGTRVHPGVKVKLIAVPTTSGTGSEATKNAVLSETGEKGYKRSLRHNNFVPDAAILDPVLTLGCPPAITAATGMDAFTQLLESYLSTAANPITDALAQEGLRRVATSLPQAFHEGANPEPRTDMAMASYLSGITLANAGLGLVHGFASSIGGYFSIPHGVICSSLMSAANKVTVRKLRQEKMNEHALTKYATIGKMFSNEEKRSDEYYTDYLLEVIEMWQDQMKIPGLSPYGVTPAAYEKIVNSTDNKNNPVRLGKEEMVEVLEMAEG